MFGSFGKGQRTSEAGGNGRIHSELLKRCERLLLGWIDCEHHSVLTMALGASNSFYVNVLLILQLRNGETYSVCSQKNHRGVFSRTSKATVVIEAPFTGRKPVLKPFGTGTQGLLKLDWVTVWFPEALQYKSKASSTIR